VVLPPPAEFRAHAALDGQPHIIVDGAPLPSTRLTLSHWPVNRTPPALRRDTSTATAFAYLDAPEFHQALPLVSNSHFDQDGLFSMFAVVDPPTAIAHRELLLAGALAGDFGIFSDRAGARLAFAIESLADPAQSPLAPAVFAASDREAALYTALLAELPALLCELNERPALWQRQDQHLAESEALIENGTVGIRELPELDLAIVEIPPELAAQPVRRYLRQEAAAVHPFAIHNRTACSRILRIQGGQVSFQYRYESWVQLASRRPPLRVDLKPLRDRLNALEDGRARWLLESPARIVPRLYLADGQPTSLPAAAIIAELAAALRSGTVAWDPYDWQADQL